MKHIDKKRKGEMKGKTIRKVFIYFKLSAISMNKTKTECKMAQIIW